MERRGFISALFAATAAAKLPQPQIAEVTGTPTLIAIEIPHLLSKNQFSVIYKRLAELRKENDLPPIIVLSGGARLTAVGPGSVNRQHDSGSVRNALISSALPCQAPPLRVDPCLESPENPILMHAAYRVVYRFGMSAVDGSGPWVFVHLLDSAGDLIQGGWLLREFLVS